MGSHQELFRDRIKRRYCWVNLRDGCIMRRYMLDSMTAYGCGAAASVLALLHTTYILPCGTCMQIGRRRRSSLPYYGIFAVISTLLKSSPFYGKWLDYWCWSHDDLRSSFTSLVFGQYVPTSPSTAEQPICLCDPCLWGQETAAILFLSIFLVFFFCLYSWFTDRD